MPIWMIQNLVILVCVSIDIKYTNKWGTCWFLFKFCDSVWLRTMNCWIAMYCTDNSNLNQIVILRHTNRARGKPMIQLKTISQKYFNTSGLCFGKASPTTMNVGQGLTHLSVHCSNAIGMYSCIFVELFLESKEFEHIATQYYGLAQFWLKGDERLSAVFLAMEIMEMMSAQCQDLKRPQSMAAQILLPT